MSVVRFPGRPSGRESPVRPPLHERGRRLAASLARLRLLARRLERDGRALCLAAARLRRATRFLPPPDPGL